MRDLSILHLQVSEMAHPVPLKFCFWNVDQARREEKAVETMWDTRSPLVKQLLRKVDADIICLVELRDLATSKEGMIAFLASFAPEYDFTYRRYCHWDEAFAMAVLVKKARIHMGDVRTVQFKNTPNDDKLLMQLDIVDKATMHTATVMVTHFSIDEAEKEGAVYVTREALMAAQHPFILCGDFNFFDDLGGIGQRSRLLRDFPDAAHPLYAEDGTKLSGTFYGYATDPQRKSFDAMSRLDHLIAHPAINVAQVYSPIAGYSFENSHYPENIYPSDHLCLCTSFTITPE